jgi:hypothetical protein
MKNYTVSLAIKIPDNWQVDVKAKNESEAKRKALKLWNEDRQNGGLANYQWSWSEVEEAFDEKTKAGIAIIEEF